MKLKIFCGKEASLIANCQLPTVTCSCSRFVTAKAFTLLEILITLAVIAVLMVAAAPYMADAWHHTEADRVQDALSTTIEKIHSEAILSGETKFINLSDPHLLPEGWKLSVRRFNDKKFRPPLPEELWQFNGEGMCDPLSLQISGNRGSFIMKFDPITAQVSKDE